LKILFVYANLEMSSMVPLGLASLSAYLKQHGYETSVFDTTFYETGENENLKRTEIGQVLSFDFSDKGINLIESDMLVDFRNMVLEYKPDLISVSMVEDVFFLGINLLNAVQDLKIPNIVGGVFATFAPERVIAEPSVEMVCIGEGEQALLEVCQALESNGSLDTIANIWHRGPNGITRNKAGATLNLNALPIPDYDIWPEEMLYRPMQGKIRLTVGIETQRGCPFSCAFCNSPSQNMLYRDAVGTTFNRRKSVEKIKEELDYLVGRYDPELIYWVADTFLAMPEKDWDAFYNMYMEFRIPFWMNTRPETITKKRVKQLEEMNCLRFNVGIEHGNYEFRKNVILRNTTNEVLLERFQCFEDAPMPIVANIIIGYPGETEELIWDSIKLTQSIAPYFDALQVFIFAPYHGTPLRDKAIAEGYITPDLIANSGLVSGSVLNSPHWTNERLKSLQRVFPLYVKLPEKFHADIKRCETYDDEGQKIFDDLVNLYQSDYMRKGVAETILRTA
jgi:anaerobic magnesium-protoporphyrin IX monomethyl ester cyclase